jgi:ribonuclease HI
MSSRKDFEIFLYKNKLNDIPLVELIPKMSSKTIELLSRDLKETIETIEMEELKNKVMYVFTDGNCKNNGREKSKGGYGVFYTSDEESPFYELNTARLVVTQPTNQKAELMAIEKLFETMNDHKDMFPSDITVVVCTDSMYSINCIEKWSKNWVRNNYKTAKGESVKNAEIIKSILELKVKCDCKIEFRHIRSHMSAPASKNSLEYKLWEGNYNVDKMINDLLEK